MEKALFIEGDVRLFGMLFLPEPEYRKQTGFVAVHPFAEEKKSAHRTLVELSRELYRNGYPSLMFDLRGCGDSEGNFADVRLEEWLSDIHRAVDILKMHTELSKLGVIGLRFSAYLSGCYMERYSGTSECIWIEPVLNPVDYLRKSLRHKLMKELCTDGVVASNRDALLQNLHNNTSVDFDGYEIGSGLFRDLVQIQERQTISETLKPVQKGLAVSVSMTGKTTKAVQEIGSLYPEMKRMTVKMELFWNKVDDVDGDELISGICEYVKGQCG
jgi:predicted alpha/beta-fold hydrolase